MLHFSRIFLAGLLSLWFALILPAHQRGRITLPTNARADIASPGCCPPAAAPVCHEPESKGGSPAKPSPRDVARCAICFLTAKLDHASTLRLDVPRLTFLERLAPTPLVSLTGVAFIANSLARGPPVLPHG